MFHEYAQIIREENKLDYFKDVWNWNDLLLYALYGLFLFYDYTFGDYTLYSIRIISCLIVMCAFIKLFFFLRIFQKLSYLV
jgi:hypothetical protein